MKFNLNKKMGLLALVFALSAQAARSTQLHATRMRWLMGTFCSIETWGPKPSLAIAAAFDEIERWDHVLSLYKEESELNALNASAGHGPFRASADLYNATEAALRMARETRGAFDPTVLPIIRRGPSALPLVGWKKIRLNASAQTIELPEPGMALDFGGIGKGWALDLAAKIMKEQGATRIFMNFGGQILALGSEKSGDWGIVLPGRDEPLRVRNASISTSGDKERPGHIVSPFDGRPVRRDFDATAILASATEADAWSTALYVLGKVPHNFQGRAFFTRPPQTQKHE